MTGLAGWPRHKGSHRLPPHVTETPMPSPAALPLASGRPEVPVSEPLPPRWEYTDSATAATVTVAEPQTATETAAAAEVQCLVCLTHGPWWAIPDIGRGPRCTNTDACVKRQMDKLYPRPLVPVATPLEPLPVAEPEPAPEAVPSSGWREQMQADLAPAGDEEDGLTHTEGEEPPEVAAETGKTPSPPGSDQGVTETAPAEAAPVVAEGAEPAEAPGEAG